MKMGKKTRRFVEHCRVFSTKYALVELSNSIDYNLSTVFSKPFSRRLHEKREEYVLSWSRQYFAKLIAKYNKFDKALPAVDSSKDMRIWTCWLQGEDSAPTLVKALLNTLRQHAGGHEIVILTEGNYQEFCDFPDFIVDKYSRGLITPQQLTDIIRACLLKKYGGLWIDSTIFISKDIPEEIFSKSIYNVKNLDPNFPGSGLVVDALRWQSYFIGSCAGSVTYSFIYDALIKYWKNMNTLIDYFFIFYLAKIAREDIVAAGQEYEMIPSNNEKCELLHPLLIRAHPYSRKEYGLLCQSDTFAYKLSWKCVYPMKTKSGEKTLAAEIL
jgi:hypothetical protein